MAGEAITWQSKRQLTVSRSSTESEYVALSNGAQEAVWLSCLLRELGTTSHQALPLHHTSSEAESNLQPATIIALHYDNQSTLKLAKNSNFHVRSKHIEVCHHFVWERVLEGEEKLDYISHRLTACRHTNKNHPSCQIWTTQGGTRVNQSIKTSVIYIYISQSPLLLPIYSFSKFFHVSVCSKCGTTL